MPVETIKCKECGSADVTEFKSDTYVCRHCEAVFKHIVPPTHASLGCEIGDCGVPPIGRCARCDRAFCTSHRAVTRQAILVDQCTECMHAQVDEVSHAFDANLAAQARYDADVAEWKHAVEAQLDKIDDPVRVHASINCAVYPA